MKTHELAKQLDLLAKLLRQLPDTELNEAITGAIHSFSEFTLTTTKAVPRPPRQLPMGLEEQLAEKSPAEIEQFLGSDEQSFTASNLLELAERIGITTSKRQSKSALINLITRHFEAEQMHSIIRSTRPDEP